MPHEIIGYLRDEGYGEGEIASLLTPMELYDDAGGRLTAGRSGSDLSTTTPLEIYDEPLRSMLAVAQGERRPPGPQIVAPPTRAGAKVVRADTEASFQRFRRGMTAPLDAVDVLTEQGRRELMGEAVGGQDVTDLVSGMRDLHGDQACIFCGRAGGGAICARCRRQAGAVLGAFGDFGAASEDSLFGDFGDRGVASEDSLFGDFGDRGVASEDSLFGDFGDFGAASEDSIFGAFGDRGAASEDSLLTDVLGDVDALESPLPAYDALQDIPLSLAGHTAQPDVERHVTAWRGGPNLYSSIRLTGWNGEPVVLTAAVPYEKSMGIVVGYAHRAGVAPAVFLGLADGFARHDGASRLIPKLAAASPAVLGAIRGRRLPVLVPVISCGWC